MNKTINAAGFLSMMIYFSLIIILIQLPGLLLPNRQVYRNWMRFTQRLWGSLILVVTWIFAPITIKLSGNHSLLKSSSFVTIMANHQIYTDWWYVWILAWFKDAHGEVKIILKDELQRIPVFGWGMQFFEFIFLARNWKIDQQRIVKNLVRAKKDDLPMMLLVFPEGTVLSRNTREKSQAHVKKLGIDFNADHLILPKSTGLYHILRCLEPRQEFLLDFTIGYSGLDGKMIPEDVYTPSKVFIEGEGPKTIHIHVKCFKISDIPGLQHGIKYSLDEQTTPEFEDWLRARYLEKDALLKYFFENGAFLEDNAVVPPQTLHINPQFLDFVSILALLVCSMTSCGWLYFG